VPSGLSAPRNELDLQASLRLLRRFAASTFAVAPGKLAETAVLTLVVGATEGIGLLLLVPLLQIVGLEAERGPLTGMISVLSSAFGAVGLKPTLGPMLSLYVVIVAARALLQRRQSVLSTAVQQEIVTTWRGRIYRAIAGMRWTAFATSRSSDYEQLLTNEVDRVGTVAFCLIDLVTIAVTSLVFVALALRVSAAITVIVLAVSFGIGLILRRRIDRAHAIGAKLSDSLRRLYSAIDEHLGSMKIAKSYGAEARHTAIFQKTSKELSDVSLENANTYASFRAQLSIASAGLLAMIVYIGHTMLAVSTAQLFVLLFLFVRLVPRVTDVYERTQTLAAVLPALTTVMEAERRCLAAAEPAAINTRPVAFEESVEFRGVTFDYGADSAPRTLSDPADAATAPAVRNVDLKIAHGETTAIVGPSGAGKSTLTDLLMGLLTPTQGEIFVDGAPLTADLVQSWRERIGYVAQETFLFHDTIRANLLWARPDADEPEIRRALELAAADRFVAGQPQGLDTVVGDRGVLVSGGERQRLSLARALLRRPALLVLDEAASSLDSENELRIQHAIEQLHQELTIVVITHRLSTIRRADMIYVVEGGTVVESGSWDELTAFGGRFRQLCTAQGIDEAPARRFQIVGS
jgi:ATP-binding cassette subfamily C protein